jgi:site-specific recombinase XerD
MTARADLSKSCLHIIVQASTGLSTSSKTSYLKSLDDWLRFAGNNPPEWTREKAQAFYDSVHAKAASNTALKVLSAIRYASRGYATQAKNPDLDFARDVVAAAGVLAAAKKPPTVLTAGQVAALFEVSQGTRPTMLRDRAVLALAIGTGMRRTTLAALPIRPWSYDKIAKCAVVEAPLRAGRTWHVPLAASIVKTIQPYEQWLGQSKLTTGAFFRKIVRSLDGYRPGHSFASDGWAIWSIVEAIGVRAGLSITPDGLRQTLISWLRESGVDPRLITVVTGQRDPEDRTQNTDYSLFRKPGAEAVDNVLRSVIA